MTMDFLTDLRLNSNKDIQLDSANDLETISGIGNLEQSVALDVMEVTQDFIGNAVTGDNVGLLEERVRSFLDSDPQVRSVETVEVETFNREAGVVTMTVWVDANNNFTLDVLLED